MKVTKSMLHPDVQPYHGQMRMLSASMRRKWATKLLDTLISRPVVGKDIEGLDCEEVHIPSSDGRFQIRTRIYKPKEQDGPLPILLYIHGGGYVMGVPELSNDTMRDFIEKRPCIVVAPDYRKAYTEPFPAGFDDCYDTLLWAAANTERLGARNGGIMIGGHSAGGGLTAAVTLKARDTQDVEIAFQMPIYPMIDHRQPDDPERAIDVAGWNTETNRVGWNAYLATLIERGSEVPAYASPSLNEDYGDFPPTITFVGEYEPFYWETRTYVDQLRKTGVEVAFEEYARCFHGFDLLSGDSAIGKEAIGFLLDAYADFYDRYVVAG